MSNTVFNEWLQTKMEEQGRKAVWLASQVNMNYHTFLYKLKSDSFNFKEEEEIKKIIK